MESEDQTRSGVVGQTEDGMHGNYGLQEKKIKVTTVHSSPTTGHKILRLLPVQEYELTFGTIEPVVVGVRNAHRSLIAGQHGGVVEPEVFGKPGGVPVVDPEMSQR